MKGVRWGEIWCPTLGGTPTFIGLYGALACYCVIVLLCYCVIVLLCYCVIVLLRYCPITLLSYCVIVRLSYCPIVLLYCIVLHIFLFSKGQ
jgi:hypothetical protein